MGSAVSSWQAWALASAAFAALTAIFAKVGVEGINADLATFIRTAVVLMSYAVLLFATTSSPCRQPFRARAGCS